MKKFKPFEKSSKDRAEDKKHGMKEGSRKEEAADKKYMMPGKRKKGR